MSEQGFSDFRNYTAARASVGCINGADHPIRAGETIGWSRKHHKAVCAPCWSRWCAAAQAQERANRRD